MSTGSVEMVVEEDDGHHSDGVMENSHRSGVSSSTGIAEERVIKDASLHRIGRGSGHERAIQLLEESLLRLGDHPEPFRMGWSFSRHTGVRFSTVSIWACYLIP